MPAPEISDRYQGAVLWPKSGFDRHGQVTVGSPVEMRVRWNDAKAERLDAQGNTVTVDATAIVDREVEIGGQMWLADDPSKSALDQWYGVGSAGQTQDEKVLTVITFDATPDSKNRYAQREVGLKRYRNAEAGS